MTTTPDRRPPLTAGASRRRRQHTTSRHRCGMRAAYLRAGRGYFWPPKPRLNHESDGVIRHAPFLDQHVDHLPCHLRTMHQVLS